MEARIQSRDFNQSLMGSSIEWQQSEVYSIDAGDSLLQAAKIMREQCIGDVLVLNRSDKGGVAGIITDRDIAMALADGATLETTVADVMTDTVVTASTSDDIFALIRLMKENGVSRLPLLNDQKKVVGVLSARNLIEIMTSALFDLTEVAEQQQERERTH